MYKGNMGKMMKQVQKMQTDMAKLQEELHSKLVEAAAGGGVVKVVANGKKEIIELNISPEAVDPEDVEMLQDLILSAVNEALRKAEDMVGEEMQKITGGLNLPPGLF
ncbi:MAG: YbaB/EbfC family nucleoid-associated protein [Firmicutes bacterium HGW-Firmicutes-13]|nr:MAG: YbaB/EbfC family nucleoid-associated protein [Firmicutes bacterium HGW-Firmicutes-13]